MQFEGRSFDGKGIEPRSYQVNISKACSKASTLVVIPTGLGKTVIAAMAIAHVLSRKADEGNREEGDEGDKGDEDAGREYGDELHERSAGKALFLAPTRPLVEQHRASLERVLVDVTIEAFTGETPPPVRKDLWRHADVMISTPQVVQNDLTAGRYDLAGTDIVVFDEAHRGTGDYPYVYIAEMYRRQRARARRRPLTLGMTASPGGDVEQILEVCRNLGLQRAEIRGESDVDVRPYVHDIQTKWRIVELGPEMKEVIRPLKALRTELAMELQRGGLLRNGRKSSTRDLLDVRRRIQEGLRSQGPGHNEEVTRRLLHLSTVQAKAMTISHALELVETQGLGPFKDFIGGLIGRRARQDGGPRSRAVSDLAQDENVLWAFRAAEGLDIEHPKVPALQRTLAEQFERAPGSRVLIFSHYRSTSDVLLRAVSGIEGARPCRFIGQADKEGDKGLSQREQAEFIERFKDGTYNVMIATSVAEEGLDIPSTDLVIFYEPVASEIRHIQRRGRTGRARGGRVEVLMTRGTKDETAFWANKGRERRRRSGVDRIRDELGRHIEVGKARLIEDPQEGKVDGIPEDRYRPDREEVEVSDGNEPGHGPIIIDNRELGSQVAKGLTLQGRKVEPCQLEIGDYLLSDRVCVERKTVRDLLDSLVDGRLFVQMRGLTRYPRPLLIVEGPEQALERGVSPKAIEGALVSIMVDFGVPVIRTRDPTETATVLARIADREWKERGPVPSRRLKGGKDTDLKERMHLIVEGLPNISAIMSRRLLAHFRTIQAIANASIDELQGVKGIGKRTAHAIHEAVTGNYSDVDEDLR